MSKTVNKEPQSKTDFEKSITKLLDGQRVTNMFIKNNVNDMIQKMKQNEKNFQTKIKNMERKIDEWEKSQNVPLEPTDGTEPPPPPETQTEQVNWEWKTKGTHDHEAGSSRSKRSRQHETVEEAMLPQVHQQYLLIVEGMNDEIFTSEAWLRVFNIKERIYTELCHEFYSTYEFDEVYTNEELNTKKIIKFRLCGRAFSWTLLDFARRLGLYHNEEIEEDGTTRHDKIQKNDLWLLSKFEAKHRNGYANVAWLLAKWMKKKGVGSQAKSRICCGQFIMRIARGRFFLTEDVLRGLSAPIYCRALDATTLIELIDADGRLIRGDVQPAAPRAAEHRDQRASMQDFYDKMGGMEIRQDAIKRMSYKQSYHLDKYAGVFEGMAGAYDQQQPHGQGDDGDDDDDDEEDDE
ncbi:hypothetical protein Tco_0427697 [Tanacetum coccineum]